MLLGGTRGENIHNVLFGVFTPRKVTCNEIGEAWKGQARGKGSLSGLYFGTRESQKTPRERIVWNGATRNDNDVWMRLRRPKEGSESPFPRGGQPLQPKWVRRVTRDERTLPSAFIDGTTFRCSS